MTEGKSPTFKAKAGKKFLHFWPHWPENSLNSPLISVSLLYYENIVKRLDWDKERTCLKIVVPGAVLLLLIALKIEHIQIWLYLLQERIVRCVCTASLVILPMEDDVPVSKIDVSISELLTKKSIENKMQNRPRNIRTLSRYKPSGS